MKSCLFSVLLAILAISVYGSKKTVPDVCLMEADPGVCKAYFPRFYYDQLKGKCKEFIYGGCRGNKNNFQTIQKCENTCKSQDKVIPPPALRKCGDSSCSFYGRCLDRNGAKKCFCSPGCPRIYAPVCGSDGKTYSNNCIMRSSSCEKNKWIYKVHNGKCSRRY